MPVVGVSSPSPVPAPNAVPWPDLVLVPDPIHASAAGCRVLADAVFAELVETAAWAAQRTPR